MKVINQLIICVFLPSLIFGQDPEIILEKAQTQMSDGRLEDAEMNLNKALKIDPSFAPALQGLSKLSLHKGDLSSANQYSNQAVQADEEYRKWSNKIMKITEQIQNGRRFVQQGQYDEAIEEYSAMLNNHPYFPEAAFYMGLTKFRQKDIEGAATYFKEALDIYPFHSKARKGLDNVTKQFLNSGNNAYKRGDLDKATAFYKKALKFDENFYLAYFQLGVLEKKMGRSKSSIDYLQKVISIKPEHDKSWFTLGSAYESDGNFDEAIKHYLKAIDLNASYSKAYGNLGKLYISKGSFKDAEDILKTVTQIDDRYADGFMHLGILYLKQEKFESAVDNLIKSTNLDKKDYNKFFNLATSYNAVENWEGSLAAARKCTELQRRFGGGWYELGVSEMGKGNKTRAKRHFDEAHKDREWREMAARKIDEINNPDKYQK
tara:strand:- start:11139 stop:12437 length:1299 start_codon:yes stop_codon:yes gene_type:complete